MQGTVEEQEDVIVRDSPEHQDYLQHQYGHIKDWVNGVETKLAISSRVLLLAYVIYTTVRASIAPALPQIAILSYILLGFDAIMLAIQSMGLEGARPGLIHLAQEMEEKGKAKEASKLMRSSSIVQCLMGATAVDIVLQSILVQTQSFQGVSLKPFIDGYSYVLLICRVVAVGMYLGDMAKLSHRGPKVISQHEAAKHQEEKEQKQIRIDNANVMSAVERGIETWAKPMVAAMRGNLESQMQQILEQYASDRVAQKAQIEALQMSGSSALSLAEMTRQIDASTQSILRQVDVKFHASANDLTQYVMRQIDASLSTSAVDYDRLTYLISEKVDAKVDALQKASTAMRQTDVHRAVRPSSSRSTGDTDKITAINSMTKSAFFVAFDEKPELLSLNSYKLAEAFKDKNATEPTARRARKEYLEAHPELKTMAM